VRDEYGGGTYFVRMLRDGKFYRQFRFSIVAPRKVLTGAPAAAAPAAAAAALDALTGVLARLEENQRRLIEAIDKRPQAPAFDPFEMFTKVAELVKATKADAPTIGAEQLITAWNKGLETAQKQVELARSISSGGGGGETGFLDLIKSALESPIGGAIADAILQRQQAGTVAQPRPGAAVAPPPALPGRVDQPVNGHAADGQDPAAILNANLRHVMQTLVASAAKNADTGLYAEFCFDHLAPELVQMLLTTPNVLDGLSQTFPAIAQFRAWFDALLAEMLTIARREGALPAVAADDQNAHEAGAGS